MTYELDAGGVNGVTDTTIVAALPDFNMPA